MLRKFLLFKEKGENQMVFTGTEKILDIAPNVNTCEEMQNLEKEAEELTKKKNRRYQWIESVT